jgi:hypothetical protein
VWTSRERSTGHINKWTDSFLSAQRKARIRYWLLVQKTINEKPQY